MRCGAGASRIHIAAVYRQEECCWQGRANMQVAHVGTLAGANHGAHLRKQASIAGAGFRKMSTHTFMLLWSIVAASQSDNRNIRPITGNTKGIK